MEAESAQRRVGFVAALVWATEQQDLSQVDSVPEEFSEEVLALASCEDGQGYQDLTALAGIEPVEVRSRLDDQTLAAQEKQSNPEVPRRARGRKDPWEQQPHPKRLAFSSAPRLRRTFRSAGAASLDADLISHPLTEDSSHDDPSLSAEDTPAFTRMRIEGRRGRRIPARKPSAKSNVPELPCRPSLQSRVVLPQQAYHANLADQRGRLTARRWKKELYSIPLEVRQRVRRALRKSPEPLRPRWTRCGIARIDAGAFKIDHQQHTQPEPNSSADLGAAWRELSPMEQHDAINTCAPGSTPGTTPWEPIGMRRAATRLSNPLCTLDMEVGTIPGTVGNVGLPGAWCNLHAVHQYKMRKLGPSPLGLSVTFSPQESETTPEGTPTACKADASIGSEESSDDSSSSLNFTQQMAMNGTTLKAVEGREHHQDGDPCLEVSVMTEKDSSPTSLSFTQQMAANGTRGAETGECCLDSFPIPDPTNHSNTSNDSCSVSGTTHVSPTESGTTHVSPTTSGTTHMSPTGSETTHASPTVSGTTHVSPTPSDTTHVSPTPDNEEPTGSLLTASAEDLRSHPVEDVDPQDEEFYAACKQATECPTTPSELLPDLESQCVRTDGGVQWRAGNRGTLAAAHNEDGPLLLVFYASLRGHTVKVLIDSGASDNFISEQGAKRCGLTTRPGTEMRVTLADSSVKITGATAYAKLNTHTPSGTYTENALALRVLPLGIKVDVILGGKWPRNHSPVTLNYEGNGSISFLRKSRGSKKGDRVTIMGFSPGKAPGDKSPKGTACAGLVDEVFLTPAQLKKHLDYAETQRRRGNEDPDVQPTWLMMAQKSQDDETSAFAPTAIDPETVEPAADTEDAEVEPEWMLKFQDFWGPEYEKKMTTALPDINGLRHDPQDEANIHMDSELSKKGPRCQRIYKKSAEELRQIRDRVETLLANGYIRPSSNPYAAHCLMVPKPGNPKESRLVIDYRLLNRQIVKDKYPLPDIQMVFDEMQGAKFFSSFDEVDGFWPVPMAPGDVEKTSFTTQMGSYEWLVMPQKLHNSPSQYQRRMQRALGHLPFVRIFIHDIVVFSNTAAEHYEHIKQLLLTCREKGVFLKRSKCQLLKKSFRFLGHCISADGCRPQHDKVAAVRDWPELETVTHIIHFLSLAGYYCKFIHCFSEIAQPLTRLTKSDVPWEWGPMQQWSFEELKKALTSAPVLALPNIKGAADGSAPFVVQTDANGIALGGVLMQDNGDGNGLRVIAYESRKFTAAEENYHTGERELGALHHCTTVTWRHYLIFTNFRLQGDHCPLEWLMEPGKELSRRQARWYMDLVEDKDAQEGLKEAGVIDPVSDLPAESLAAMEDGMIPHTPPAARPHWAQEVDSWLAAVETISVAETALDLCGSSARKNPRIVNQETSVPSKRVARSLKKPVNETHMGAPLSPCEERPTASQSPSTADSGISPAEQSCGVTSPKASPTATRLMRRKARRTPEDTQNWRVRKELFDKYSDRFGKFDVDACCDLGGHNRQVNRFWSDCRNEQWRGLRVWCNPPYNSSHITVEAILHKYIAEWRADPEYTSAVFILPDLQSKLPAWRRLFRLAGMQIVEVIPTHDDKGEPNQVFENPDEKAFNLRWPVLVVHAPQAKPQLDRVRHPRRSPAVLRKGEAADFRDAVSQQSDAKFLRALKAEYAREGPLRALRDKVKTALHQSLQDFRLVGDVVWRTTAGRHQLVLGEDSPLREVVIRHAHESPSAGHTGRDKTLERVLRRFWWPGATDDVGSWVASCPLCPSVRPRGTYPDGLLNPHSIPNRPWQDVAVDFVTGLPLSEGGNDAFVAFTCKLSKMVHIVPMNFGDSSAATVARIYFDSVWRIHGAPMKIVSDRDPCFQDAFGQDLMRLMGIKIARTTPYNPRSDGQTEHANRVIEDMLRSFVDANVEDWDLYATNVEFAINDSRSESTGFTPFELVFGFSPLSQLDMFMEAAQSPATQRKGGVGTSREAKNLTEKVMDRSICMKLIKRWHGPVPVVERFFSDTQMAMPEADRGAPVGATLAQLITNPCDELETLEQMEQDTPLPWKYEETAEDGSLALLTELSALRTNPASRPRLLVLFSGTGSVEREFLNCFPTASVVTLDSEPSWHPTHT
ncbi:hypothetical protein CYMTET_39877 [Cymbomonas tetramitiformis]|uniref:RNA-directed DNA polymerase n=1 Tax=Cymbomonas tetramitiformis TaxID=36881 RepID=A0AAE0CBF4_9CHLO|nr:hypothetical protein CYMTET_39877 [Cymbomonas tetramitiformis]